jgi:DNA-binding transcriptional LysR family regulator
MALELQQLRQVVALAEHRSFVRAAAAMHISQPALSRSIQNLERRFGGSLFVRSSAGVIATDMGRLYIERARDLLRMADELEGQAIGHAALRTGHVNVGGGAYPTDAFLGHAAARFVELYPRMSVQLHGDNWDGLVQKLRSRTLDFFVAETSLLSREPDLEVGPLSVQHPIYYVARAVHPLARSRTAISSADVMAFPFATPSRIPPRVLIPLLAAHREASARLDVARPFPAIECNGLGPVKRIVASSDAVTASMLSCIADELENGTLRLLATEPWMTLQYGMVSLRDRPWTQAAEKLRDLVLEAERSATVLGEQLLERHGPRNRRRRRRK